MKIKIGNEMFQNHVNLIVVSLSCVSFSASKMSMKVYKNYKKMGTDKEEQ